MLEKDVTKEELRELLGESLFDVWQALCARIDASYEMERIWDSGGKRWQYEYKYRRGGKTLCALYAKEQCLGIMIIFGKAERERFEGEVYTFSEGVRAVYDRSKTYHDGKWMMFEPKTQEELEPMLRLLQIKRRPNRK